MAAMVEKLLPDVSGEGRYGQITVDTWFDRLMKALTVWLPLLVSGTLFLGEITGEPQNVVCYPPSNFTIPQANYLNGFCKESLVSEQITSTMFPYFVLLFALLMYIPHLFWKMLLGTELAAAIANIMGAIEDSRKAIDSTFITIVTTPGEIKMKETFAQQSMPRYAATIGLDSSKKWWKFQLTKIISLFIFALACLAYLIWFAVVSQKNDIFVCSAKLSSSNVNGTKDDEYVESVCKVVGKQYFYYVSIFLSMSFCIAVLLPIFFVFYIKLTRGIFLLDVLNGMKSRIELSGAAKLKQLPKMSPFSDFSIISLLCGENRHILPWLYRFMNTETVDVPFSNSWVDTAAAEDKSTEAAETLNLHDQNSDADSGATGSATSSTGSIRDVEADIHTQPSSCGSSSSFLSFHTEDETRPQGPTGEETVPLVYHRGSKNKSNPIEKETSI